MSNKAYLGKWMKTLIIAFLELEKLIIRTDRLLYSNFVPLNLTRNSNKI